MGGGGNWKEIRKLDFEIQNDYQEHIIQIILVMI